MEKEKMSQLLTCTLCKKSFSVNDARFTKPISDDFVYGKGFPVRCMNKRVGIHTTHNPRVSDGDTIVTCPYCEGIHVRPY